MSLISRIETFQLKGVFTISRGSRTEAQVVSVEIRDGDLVGNGECVPYKRYDESLESVQDQIKSVADAITPTTSGEQLAELMPAGAARNAIDCALIDLAAKKAGQPAHELLGLDAPKPVTTAYTLSLDSPENMNAAAKEHSARPLLKMKLGGDGDIERVAAVREGAPDARLIVDANEAWEIKHYESMVPALDNLSVYMIEQPFHATKDEILRELDRPVTICADESCHDSAGLPRLVGLYDMVNLKLDKTGGLTEALALKKLAQAEGFRIMVGCMVGTSLAMAPAHLLAQGVELVDIDGPLLLAEDRDNPLEFANSDVMPPRQALWG